MTKFVFDSSYLIPFFGIEINIRNFKEGMEKIEKNHHIYLINICSFIEIKWIIFHFIKKLPDKKEDFLNAYQEGLIFFIKSNQFELVSYLNLEIDAMSNKVRDAGILDYFDALIYATAKVQDAILITEDRLLHEISSQKLIKNKVLNWNAFIKSFL
ncbi:MAG: PIN domain-containing protein [Candidatus Helarchaeota archaeon]